MPINERIADRLEDAVSAIMQFGGKVELPGKNYADENGVVFGSTTIEMHANPAPVGLLRITKVLFTGEEELLFGDAVGLQDDRIAGFSWVIYDGTNEQDDPVDYSIFQAHCMAQELTRLATEAVDYNALEP